MLFTSRGPTASLFSRAPRERSRIPPPDVPRADVHHRLFGVNRLRSVSERLWAVPEPRRPPEPPGGARARDAAAMAQSRARRALGSPPRGPPVLTGQNGESPGGVTTEALCLPPTHSLSRRMKWLRIRRWLRTRSQRSQRDGLRALALSRDCKCLRIRVVGRCDPGHSHGFAPSRDERGAKRDRRAHVRRWRAFEAPRGPGALGRETGHTGETGRRHPGPNVPST